MKTKLHYYYTFFIVSILVLIIFAVFVVTTYIISEYVEKQIAAKINQFQIYVESNRDQAIENIVRNCRYTASNQTFISAVENHDVESITSIIDCSYKTIFGDVSLISDSSNSIITKSDNLNGISNISELPGVLNLKNKQSSAEYTLINFWNIKEENYLVCTISVLKDSSHIGILSIGSLISNLFKQSFSEDINFALLNKSKVLFSQFGYDDVTISEFVKTYRPIADAILATSSSSDIFLTEIESSEFYSKLIPFGYDLPAYFLVSVSKSNEFLILDSLVENLAYVLIIGSLILVFIIYIFSNRSIKQVEKLNAKFQELKKIDSKIDTKISEDLKATESKKSEIKVESKSTVLFSRIISLNNQNNENEISFLKTNNNYLKIQTELIELYDGKIEYIINNKILSSFIGEDSIDKSLQCSLAIMKLINKESNSSKYKIGIGINYGSIFYGGEKASLSGETVELAESIVDISKPGQILINNELISKTDFKYSVAESKNWKFKNMKKDIKLVNISGEMKE